MPKHVTNGIEKEIISNKLIDCLLVNIKKNHIPFFVHTAASTLTAIRIPVIRQNLTMY
jgi:hypothetical protein